MRTRAETSRMRDSARRELLLQSASPARARIRSLGTSLERRILNHAVENAEEGLREVRIRIAQENEALRSLEGPPSVLYGDGKQSLHL